MRGPTCIFWTNLTLFALEADIDTPALIVELDTLEENLARMQACRVNSYRNLRKMLFNVGFGLRQVGPRGRAAGGRAPAGGAGPAAPACVPAHPPLCEVPRQRIAVNRAPESAAK